MFDPVRSTRNISVSLQLRFMRAYYASKHKSNSRSSFAGAVVCKPLCNTHDELDGVILAYYTL
jgi:hypothetical protein